MSPWKYILYYTPPQKNVNFLLISSKSVIHTMHSPTESVDWCQCCPQRGSFSNFEGPSHLFGNHNTPEVVHTTNNSCCGADSFVGFQKPFLAVARLWCPIFSSVRTPSSTIDHGTHYACTASATGSVQARGRGHSLRSLYLPPAALPSLPLFYKLRCWYLETKGF